MSSTIKINFPKKVYKYSLSLAWHSEKTFFDFPLVEWSAIFLSAAFMCEYVQNSTKLYLLFFGSVRLLHGSSQNRKRSPTADIRVLYLLDIRIKRHNSFDFRCVYGRARALLSSTTIERWSESGRKKTKKEKHRRIRFHDDG